MAASLGTLARVATLAALACTFASPAQAQSRWVFINGERLTDAQVAWLQHTHCAFVPDGRYWHNPRTGAWGHAGHPAVQGYYGQPCLQAKRRSGPSLSERDRLYRPGEIINGR